MGEPSAEQDVRREQLRQTALGAWNAGRIDEAARAFATLSRDVPTDAGIHGNLGVALRRLGRPAAAIASYRRALALSPAEANVLSNLGNALRDLGRLEDAETWLRRAVRRAPDNLSFSYNLALVLRDRRQHAEARGLLEALAAAKPDDGDIAWDLALSRLYERDWARGLAGYEARWRLARAPRRALPGPRLKPGVAVAGRRVFLHAEQGFGDALQFARFVPALAAQGAIVLLESLPDLAPLFATLPGVRQVVIAGTPPPAYDLWAPMLSLPHLLGLSDALFSVQTPYLAPPATPALLAPRPPGARLAVGLIWAGKPVPRDRSWPLETLLPLLDNPQVVFHSLQLGPRAADLAALGVEHLVAEDITPRLRSFADTARAMADLDLIISIDSAPAHLAGALGRPVWTLLRYVSDWRWGDEGQTTGWYPSMRLFRQPAPDDFTTPVADMARALRDAALS